MKTNKLKLYGFNNLTKTLSFNMYDICYAVSPESRRQYIEYIDEQYNAERLTCIPAQRGGHHRRPRPQRRQPGL